MSFMTPERDRTMLGDLQASNSKVHLARTLTQLSLVKVVIS